DIAVVTYSGSIADPEHDSVALFRGDGKGGFAAPRGSATGRAPVRAAAADVDGDGIADLAVCQLGGGVKLLLGGRAGLRDGGTLGACGTRTIVHFCAATAVSPIVSGPWSVVSSAGAALAACGLVGLAYAVVVVRTAARQTLYKPVLEDWVWHGVLPLVAYGSL